MVEELSERLKQSRDYYLYDLKWNENNYNWLALGNSLTFIESWGRGICSTYPDNDYFGLVKKALNKKRNTEAFRYNFSAWERVADRKSVLDLIDKFLSPKINLVTVQLGENVSDLSSYETDLENLIDYIRKGCPSAQIILIDDFWSSEKSGIRKTAASVKKCDFADLSQIRGKKEFQSQAGLIYYLPNGDTAFISKEAETHPGDKGMEYIASKILELVIMKE